MLVIAMGIAGAVHPCQTNCRSPVMWTLEALVKLVRKGAMSPPEALLTGNGIHEVNAAYITDEVLAEFRRLIGHDG